ncbi:hypothetical protein HJD18_00060 [Thermoleophilia bacterium SCSIO 60948]|nr:hypothetical protein HJD18_00060 [Thermoleophilia bacterium SCSIO 60948]
MLRRLLALGAGIVIVILLAIGVNSCLDARKERSFENYISDLSAIVNESNQLSGTFFERFTDPAQDVDDVSIGPLIAGDRGTAQTLLGRVENLDVPDELASAQDELVLAFELRRDALADIADRIDDALGTENRDEAFDALALDMKTLLASDVIYERARNDILSVLEEQGVAGSLPRSEFLPPESLDDLLDPAGLAALLSSITSGGSKGGQLSGVALLGVSLDPGGTALSADGLNTVSTEEASTIVAEVQNQGDGPAEGVVVDYELSGASGTSTGEGEIETIEPGETGEAEIPLDSQPATGEELTLTVTAQPIAGEEVADNNELSFPIVFE